MVLMIDGVVELLGPDNETLEEGYLVWLGNGT
jgi:hypothetical protein